MQSGDNFGKKHSSHFTTSIAPYDEENLSAEERNKRLSESLKLFSDKNKSAVVPQPGFMQGQIISDEKTLRDNITRAKYPFPKLTYLDSTFDSQKAANLASQVDEILKKEAQVDAEAVEEAHKMKSDAQQFKESDPQYRSPSTGTIPADSEARFSCQRISRKILQRKKRASGLQ